MRKLLRLVVALGLGTTALAQSPFGRNSRVIEAGRHGTAAIEVDLVQGVAEGELDELELRLPDRESPVRLARKRFSRRDERGGTWLGIVDGRDDSQVLLSFHEGLVAGTIRLGADLYEVRPSAGGQIVERIDPSRYPDCAVAPEIPAADQGATGPGRLDAVAAAADAGVRDAAGIQTIDLLSMYTPEARAAAGGAAQIQTVIQAAVDLANQAFANSGVGIVYRLVKTAEATRHDSGDLNADIYWLLTDSATKALRDTAGADLVSLVVENGGGYCGMGYVMRTPGAGFADYAMQVAARGCILGNLSLAHEHGHNLGMEHDAANAPAPAKVSYPWSYGQTVNGVYRTVMSYSSTCPNGCPRVPFFSNPNVSYMGYPTGAAETSDNARTANLTAAIVAGFRSGPAAAAPASPDGLAATAVSSTEISLTWVDRSNDESGFRVERSAAGGASFTVVAVLGANITSYRSVGLAPSTSYAFRVRSYNANGESAESNTVTATTQAPPVPTAPSGLIAQAKGTTQVDLVWTDTSSDEDGFRVERAASGDGVYAEIGVTGAGVTGYASTGLTPGVTYLFRVRAYNAAGSSGYSNPASATTSPLPPPAAPAGLMAAENGYSAISLTWTDASSDESGFRIERAQSGGGFVEIATVGAGVTSYVSGGLSAGTSYSFRVRAYNANGNSSYSNSATAVTRAPEAEVIAAPAGFAGRPDYGPKGKTLVMISLTWIDGNGETSYRVERCKAATADSACAFQTLNQMAANATSLDDRGVFALPGFYRYRIRAESSTSVSAWAEILVDAR